MLFEIKGEVLGERIVIHYVERSKKPYNKRLAWSELHR